jgi:hypothetical protein
MLPAYVPSSNSSNIVRTPLVRWFVAAKIFSSELGGSIGATTVLFLDLAMIGLLVVVLVYIEDMGGVLGFGNLGYLVLE